MLSICVNMCVSKQALILSWEIIYWYFTICFAYLNLLLQSHILHFAKIPMLLHGTSSICCVVCFYFELCHLDSHFCFVTLGCKVLNFFYKIVM
jgi:hypothetical protein